MFLTIVVLYIFGQCKDIWRCFFIIKFYYSAAAGNFLSVLKGNKHVFF